MINNKKYLECTQAKFIRSRLRRILFLKAALIFGLLIVVARLIQIQIIKSSDFKEFARKQYEAKIPLPANRGNIYDRNGNILASNTMFIDLAVDATAISKEDGLKLVNLLSKVFNKPVQNYLKILNSEKQFEYLERTVSPEYRKYFEAEKIHGFIIINQPKRLYHYGTVGGQLLGGTNIDNLGLSGIELFANQYLRGVNGYMILQRDGYGRARASIDYPRIEPENGKNLYLTIDLAYQSIAEEELKRGLEKAKADAGILVMLKPATGEVLAIAQCPSFNPNDFSIEDISNQKIRAVTDMFEPGSVFKLVTASAALEHHLVKPEQKFNAENGKYNVNIGGRKFRLITDTKPHDFLTFQEAMEQSSNIVMAKVSDLVGVDRFYTRARDFGFGVQTMIDLPGEVKGKLKKPNEWSGTTLNTIAYGYEVGTTPIQITAAYGAVANKGILMKPYVIRKIANEHGEIIQESKPLEIRRSISEETAKKLSEFFKGVVLRGTAKTTIIDGICIAGKTGTSRLMIDGKYMQEKFLASFVGYFPAEKPQVVCLVMVDNPRVGGYTGGTTAAPIFREIVNRIRMTKSIFSNGNNGVMAANHTTNKSVVVPDVANLQLSIALKLLESQNLTADPIGTGKIVLTQEPLPGDSVMAGSKIKLIFEKKPEISEGYHLIPNVVGLPLRRAINRLTKEGFESVIYGSGTVISQSPDAGQVASQKTVVSIICSDNKLAGKMQ